LSPLLLAITFLLTLGATLVVTGLAAMRRDHARPPPRAGWVPMALVLVPALTLLAVLSPRAVPDVPLWTVLAGALGLTAVAAFADGSGVPRFARLGAQAGAVGLGLGAIEAAGPVFQGLLPRELDLAASGLLWLWFVNVVDLMDGVEGLTASGVTCFAGGLALIALLGSAPQELVAPAVTVAAVSLGLLVWNRPPAAVALGSAGSLPLGYVVGWLLLDAAARGVWAAALILPAYFLADATLTPARGVSGGAAALRPHVQHFYQRALRRGMAAREILLAVLAANLVLVALALGAARGEPEAGLIGAAVVVLMLVRYLLGIGRPRLFR
jgi:UDP-N-acetylmuramyl pentapeptide phosphotransferase/UDP-N-acetylglucosamine-1-phosphate transferase